MTAETAAASADIQIPVLVEYYHSSPHNLDKLLALAASQLDVQADIPVGSLAVQADIRAENLHILAELLVLAGLEVGSQGDNLVG